MYTHTFNKTLFVLDRKLFRSRDGLEHQEKVRDVVFHQKDPHVDVPGCICAPSDSILSFILSCTYVEFCVNVKYARYIFCANINTARIKNSPSVCKHLTKIKTKKMMWVRHFVYEVYTNIISRLGV